MKVANDLIQNPDGLSFKLNRTLEKLNKEHVKIALGSYYEEVKLFISFIRDWLTGQYRGVSRQSLIYAIVAIVYFLNPTDLVPDFILGVGFVDDIGVIAWALKKISSDLEKYRQWKDERETA